MSNSTAQQQVTIWWRFPAKLISYLLHPLFMPILFMGWLSLRFSYEFSGMDEIDMLKRLVVVFVNTVFFPAFVVFLLWRLGFSDNILLRTQKERIIPYIATMFFYWWVYYLSRNFTDQPLVAKAFFLGSFICISLGLIANSFFKISMHGMGVSGLFTAMLITCFVYEINFGLDLTIALLALGITASARLLLGEHSNAQIYLAVAVGVISQVIGFLYVLS
ncbi:MAG TPA: hypothetical protein DCL43_06305 [Chitinophagaceae bacterium]|nr:hypothetical protein [Chitinophagaceae bacterium]